MERNLYDRVTLDSLPVDDRRSTAANLRRYWLGDVGLAAGVSFVYFLFMLVPFLGLRLKGVSVFYPAAGISACVLIGLGPRARWPVSAGVMIATLILWIFAQHQNLAITSAAALCDVAEPLIIASLVRRYSGRNFTLGRLRNVLVLFSAVLAGTTVSSFAYGVASLVFLPRPFLSIWWIWFASDAIGVVAIAPLAIALHVGVREPQSRRELKEGAVALMALGAMTATIIWLPHQMWETMLPGVLLLPILFWLAANCRPVYAASAVSLLSLIVVCATIFGIGHFGDIDLSIDDRIAQAQAAILFVALSALVLAALSAERRKSEERVSRANVILESERARLAHSNMMLERERDNKLMNVQAALASIAHEVRQPLAAIEINSHAALRWLGRTPPDYDEVRAALNRITGNSQRTSEVFEAFRTLFGKAGQARQAIDVNEIVRDVLQSFHGELKSHGVTTHTELTSGLPLADGNSVQLREVVSNLVSNAIEAMIATTNLSPVLAVKTELRGRDAIVVSVRDSGPGIDPERLDSIFGAFVTTKAHGTGLGLAICRMIIQNHGGQLSASSDGKSGALFQFVLPIDGKGTGPAN